jgi:Glycosyl transferases group 1
MPDGPDDISWVTARAREAAAKIRRYRALHPVLAAGRRVRSATGVLLAPNGRVRRVLARGSLIAHALAARTAHTRRRAELDAAVAGLALPAPAPLDLLEVRSTSTRAAIATVAGSATELLAFVAPTTELAEPAALRRLAAAIAGDVVAATPRTVHPFRPLHQATADDLLTRALGFDVVLDGLGVPRLRARQAGSPVPARAPAAERVAAGTDAVFVVTRAAYDAAGGLDAALELDAAIVDLCTRLTARGGGIVAEPSSLMFDHRPVATPGACTDPFATRPKAWSAIVGREGPALARVARAGGAPTIAITTAAPSSKIAARWGDWHFGGDLARALERLGYVVRLQTADQANSDAGRACDAHVVLRGLTPVSRTTGQRHILWIISHPETVDPSECDDADHVFVASARFADALRTRTDTAVETLWQATDHHRFRPRPAEARYAQPLAVVAKTRTVMRPIVADALAAGLRPAIYGSGWEEFVEPNLIVADYVPNEELPIVYASTGVLLNDHWDTMRAWGFVSNRIFDALACETPVVSDTMPEIDALFAGAVPTTDEPDELRAIVDGLLAEPEAARARARAGRERVLEAHTFDHRARTFAQFLKKFDLAPPADPGG